jgi:hypothetical protein
MPLVVENVRLYQGSETDRDQLSSDQEEQNHRKIVICLLNYIYNVYFLKNHFLNNFFINLSFKNLINRKYFFVNGKFNLIFIKIFFYFDQKIFFRNYEKFKNLKISYYLLIILNLVFKFLIAIYFV